MALDPGEKTASFLQKGCRYRLVGTSIGPSDYKYRQFSLGHRLAIERLDEQLLLMVQKCTSAHSIKSRVVQKCALTRERDVYHHDSGIKQK